MSELPPALLRLAFVPLVLQGAAMFFDEFYFHARRRLGPWERIGHPVDSAAFLACLCIVLFCSPVSAFWFSLFSVGAVVSTLLITKDEWVHARECTGGEQWLHAVLFILHPLVLLVCAFLWPRLEGPAGADMKTGFAAYVTSVAGFMLYQTLYWNVFARARR